jgi:pyruvate, water dikinase
MFGADPVTGDTSRIVVEATWGLGEGAVGGKVQVDLFVLDKATLEVRERTVADKLIHIAAAEGGVKEKRVPHESRLIPCISDEALKELGKVEKFLEERLSAPQDIEWALDPDLDSTKNIRLFQTRPVKLPGAKAPLSPGQNIQSSAERLLDIFAERLK